MTHAQAAALHGMLTDWPIGDGIYFAFISGLTIGYGDLASQQAISRLLAVMIGCVGILLMGLVTAVGVRSLDRAWRQHEKDMQSSRNTG